MFTHLKALFCQVRLPRRDAQQFVALQGCHRVSDQGNQALCAQLVEHAPQ